MVKTIDLNCDLGESFGAYKIGNDTEIIPLITSANIACGWHGGDPCIMKKTVEFAQANSIAVGAHPSYPDLLGFGRRAMNLSFDELSAYMIYQIGALEAFCRACGIKMQHVKPHGALYNTASKDELSARTICEAIQKINPELILMGPSGSNMIKIAKEYGIKTACEVFADRAYENDGSLVSRSKPGAIIEDNDLAAERVLCMVRDGYVRSVDGKEIEIQADTVCVHGDNAHALELIKKLRALLCRNNIEIKNLM